MSPEAFAASVLGWHDFYLAASGSTAALLGLLFVGVSINIRAIAAEEREDLRARAGQAFVNLVSVLVIALVMLIPAPDPRSMAMGLGMVAVVGSVRVVQTLSRVLRAWKKIRNQLPTVRRILWTVVADLVLIFIAWRLWFSPDVAVISNLIAVVFVLLVGAADLAWEMLVEVSRESATSGPPACPSRAWSGPGRPPCLGPRRSEDRGRRIGAGAESEPELRDLGRPYLGCRRVTVGTAEVAPRCSELPPP